jgi:hypothetical protein
MSLKITVDEDLPRQVVQILQGHGYDAASVIEQGMGGWKDPQLWIAVQSEERFLVTTDKGFGDIHANPVKDGIVADITQWPYSNYLEWIGKRDGKLVDKAFVQDNFDTPDEYRKFVLEYLRSRQLPKDVRRYLNSLEGDDTKKDLRVLEELGGLFN